MRPLVAVPGNDGSIVDASFTLEIGLGDVDGLQDEVLGEIGDQLDEYLAVARQDPDGPLVVTLTVPAADLWLSLLLAMAAVTNTGYAPLSVEAMPTAEFTRRRGSPDLGWSQA